MDIVFTAPPGPGNECVFVEVEIGKRGVSVGEWVERADGSHALRINSEALETLSRATKVAEVKGLVQPVKR